MRIDDDKSTMNSTNLQMKRMEPASQPANELNVKRYQSEIQEKKKKKKKKCDKPTEKEMCNK